MNQYGRIVDSGVFNKIIILLGLGGYKIIMIITNSALRSSLVICHFIQQATSYVNVTQCEQLIRLVCATQVISAFRAF